MALMGAYLFYEMTRATTFSMRWPSRFSDKLLVAMAVVAALRLLTTKLLRWKTVVALALAAIYYMVYRSDKYQFLLYLAVLTVGLIDIDYRRIIKVYLATTGVVYCTAVLAGTTGAITNYVYASSGRGLRSAWGICYPTDFASKGLFLLVMLWVVWKKLPDWAMLILCAAFIWMARVIAFSWNSTICGAVFLCAILYCILERQVIDRHRGLGWMKRGTELLETIAFPLCALAMFGLMLIYARGMNAGYRLDNLLSRRLELGVGAWKEHGLSLFGTPFKQVGNGFSTMPPANYSFIDSSYPLILIRYGAVMFLATCAIWGNMARQAIRCKDRRLLLALGIIAIHSFTEHHFTEVRYNILLAMPLASFATAEVEERVAAVDRKTILAHVVTAMVCCVILWLVAPIAVSGLRTVLEYKGLCMAKKTGWTLMGIYLGIIAFVIAAIWAVDRLIRSLLTRRAVAVPAIALALCACVGIGGWLYTNNTVAAAVEANAELIKADREALEIAARSASGRVYSGILPAAYHGQIEGISYSPFTEDDLARNIGDTFLVSNDTERAVFLNTGSLYVEISDKHALYSGDRAVIEALTEAGYHATGFYSTAHEVDLAQAAKLNKLSYDEKKGIILSGKKRTMKKGPYFDLYAGKYTVTYDLTLPKGEARDDSVVCTLSVTAEKGKKTLLEKEITGSQFDENRTLSVSIPFSVGDTKNIAFSGVVEKGKKVYIRNIQYVRYPDSDIHVYYDSKIRKIREEYYLSNGEPTYSSDGYFACDYYYSDDSYTNETWFYDKTGALMCNKSGYAGVVYTFNEKRQAIRFEYYDVGKKLTMTTDGYSISEREYSDAGNVILMRFYNTERLPVIIQNGFAEIHYEYNERNQQICEAYFGCDGKPMTIWGGCAVKKQVYDDEGNIISRSFWGTDGKLVVTTFGFAEVRWYYNGMHQITRTEYLGADGELICTPSGQAVIQREFDNYGNIVRELYQNTQLQPVMISDGYSEIRREYSEKNKLVREMYFDAFGLPVNSRSGCCMIEYHYNTDGQMVSQDYVDLGGNVRTESLINP